MIRIFFNIEYFSVDIGDTKICARDVQNKIDACQGRIDQILKSSWKTYSAGDSGGPMVIDSPGPDGKCEFLNFFCFIPNNSPVQGGTIWSEWCHSATGAMCQGSQVEDLVRI